MDDNYYLPVSRKIYDDFLKEFPAERLLELHKKKHQVADFAQLGAGLLVNKLKSPTDRFTSLVPSEKTKDFKANAYAVTEDLGIEGNKIPQGFEITKVQKHSDAYQQGVRAGDWLLAINGKETASQKEESIRAQLSPVLASITRLRILTKTKNITQEISLESKSYFKETVSVLPSAQPGVFILNISHFNQKTSHDFSDEIAIFTQDKIKHLIIDLRNNSGGPPLAAREILGFFLPVNDPLFAIARKKQRPVMLSSPPQPVAYHGPVTILVNQKTGSAAEMFSGLMQAKQIAVLVGQKTAGATYLKGLYDLGDGSTIFMITSLTYFYDRRVFPPDGIVPDTLLNDNEDSLKFALEHLR